MAETVMHNFTNRDLSKKFGINLAKLKRWSRDFLAPDPKAGMQCGYARIYNIEDAFTIFLGGHLVSRLNFTIAETKILIRDLVPWFRKQGFLNPNDITTRLTYKQIIKKKEGPPVKAWEIHIRRGDKGFSCEAKGIMEFKFRDNKDNDCRKIYEEKYMLCGINT